ncbi:NAD(P)H-binding protein [Nocardia inohanensis]|uniref:NAD(P)H-binding protein n=1 Tax=Nocardia inohanensis TaxID=209246 RepID=UPI00082C4A6B|nr:NAD(P)H-binding protein [Nocardia inohanensis]
MIVITGATGTIGSEVVRILAARGVAVRAVTRNPEAAVFPENVEVVRGDYTDTASLTAAFAGAEAAFLVGLLGPEFIETEQALIESARAAGVRRLVKLSAIGTGDPELGRVGTWHVPGEQAVRDSGVEWTILRPSSFASNTLSWAAMILAGQAVPNMTGTGTQGVIDPRDVSAVAAEALLSDAHAGRVYTLTGPELLGTADQVAALADATGRTIDVFDIAERQAREFMLGAGMSEEYTDGSLAGQAFVRAGGNAIVTGDVEEVLGRAPRTYAEWVRDHAAAFTGVTVNAG